jgi:hypothetical protein
MGKNKNKISDEERNCRAIKIILRAQDLNKEPIEIETEINL